jgi:hypothetical protein
MHTLMGVLAAALKTAAGHGTTHAVHLIVHNVCSAMQPPSLDIQADSLIHLKNSS